MVDYVVLTLLVQYKFALYYTITYPHLYYKHNFLEHKI
ncbi:hypothetical protein Dtox_2718 [Desulfofarcimen acetoxidans DSM 771]|jgi:hypothetical protein|uniref:Uncharacterized protein n=1 Tax=Desulfofarcimen acetoxidans (strain ATCC 49208 / DSM 771 / KCTC 5769 / VKM B-1644 / 5575) TaxID=485916 RepID=C8W1M6_DESAS|nr:hypothetical protein Dtox_2718 [Desulfofarcimen acetoxidans DSM 771]